MRWRDNKKGKGKVGSGVGKRRTGREREVNLEDHILLSFLPLLSVFPWAASRFLISPSCRILLHLASSRSSLWIFSPFLNFCVLSRPQIGGLQEPVPHLIFHEADPLLFSFSSRKPSFNPLDQQSTVPSSHPPPSPLPLPLPRQRRRGRPGAVQSRRSPTSFGATSRPNTCPTDPLGERR